MANSGKWFLGGLLDRVLGRKQHASLWNRNGKKEMKERMLTMEPLEERQLLAVSLAEFRAIASAYPEFTMGTYMTTNIIEITAHNLSASSFNSALNSAMATSGNDLIYIRTANPNFMIDFGDVVTTIDYDPVTYGSITIVSDGNTPLQLVSDTSSVLKISSGIVQLGNLELIGLEKDGATVKSSILEIGSSAKVVQSDVTLTTTTYWDQTLQDGSDARITYKNGIWSVDFQMAPQSTVRSYITGLETRDQVDAILANRVTTNEGSYVDDNYYDAELTGTYNLDDNLSWAATAADMLSYTGWGIKSGKTEDEVFSYFNSNWSNQKNYVEGGIEWYMNGTVSTYNPTYSTVDDDGNVTSTSGDIWASPTANGGNLYGTAYSYNDYGGSFTSRSIFNSVWTSGTSPMKTVSNLLEGGFAVSTNISSNITKTTTTTTNIYVGGVLTDTSDESASVYDYRYATSAVTIWGYMYDSSLLATSTDYYLGIYATDPQSDMGSPASSMPDRLSLYTMQWVPATGGMDYYSYEFSTLGSKTYYYTPTITETTTTADGVVTRKEVIVQTVDYTKGRAGSFSYLAMAAGRAPVSSDLYEPNNTAAQVDDTSLNPLKGTNSSNLGIVEGEYKIAGLTLVDSDPEDWFKFQTEKTSSIGDSVSVEYNKTLFSGDLQIYLYTRINGELTLLEDYNYTKTTLSNVDEYGSGVDRYKLSINFKGLPPGEYYVQVRRLDSTVDCKNYDLIFVTCSDDYFEVNNTRSDVDNSPVWDPTSDQYSPNLGALTENTVLSDLVLKQEKAYSSQTVTETDAYRFTMTGYGGSNSYIDLIFDDTNLNIQDAYLELRIFKMGDSAYYGSNPNSWGVLVATGEEIESGVLRASLEGCDPGIYYIKVDGYIGAENLLNYKININLRNADDPEGIGVTSKADFYVTNPDDVDWSTPLVISKEKYEQFDPETGSSSSFSSDYIFYSQDTIFANISFATANDSSDNQVYDIKVVFEINGTRLDYTLEVPVEKGNLADNPNLLRDFVFAKLLNEVVVSAYDGKFYNGTEEWDNDFQDGMVISVLNTQQSVECGYIFDNGRFVAISTSNPLTNGATVTIENTGKKLQVVTNNWLINGQSYSAIYRDDTEVKSNSELWGYATTDTTVALTMLTSAAGQEVKYIYNNVNVKSRFTYPNNIGFTPANGTLFATTRDGNVEYYIYNRVSVSGQNIATFTRVYIDLSVFETPIIGDQVSPSVTNALVSDKGLTFFYNEQRGELYQSITVPNGSMISATTVDGTTKSLMYQGVCTYESDLYAGVQVGDGLFLENYSGTTTGLQYGIYTNLEFKDGKFYNGSNIILINNNSLLKNADDLTVLFLDNTLWTGYKLEYNTSTGGNNCTVVSSGQEIIYIPGVTLTSVFLDADGTDPVDDDQFIMNKGTFDEKTLIYKSTDTLNGFYIMEVQDTLVRVDGQLFSVSDNTFHETFIYGTDDFFIDGTKFLFYEDNLQTEGFGASYLKIAPASLTTQNLTLYQNNLNFIISSADGYAEYDYTNNNYSQTFLVFRPQDDFFVPNASFNEMINSTNTVAYENGEKMDPTLKYNPNLGPITGDYSVIDLVMLTEQDWFSFELQGETNETNKVTISFEHALGDLDLYVYKKYSNYASGMRLVGYSSTLNDEETVSLNFGSEGEGTYYIKVVGFKGAINPNYTLNIVGVEPIAVNDIELELADPVLSNSSAKVSWNKVDSESDYVFGGAPEYFSTSYIEWMIDPRDASDPTRAISELEWANADKATVGRGLNSYTITGLDPDMKYVYRVRAENMRTTDNSTPWVNGEFVTEDYFNDTHYYAIIVGGTTYNFPNGQTISFASTDAAGVYDTLIDSSPQWVDSNIEYLTGSVTLQQINDAFARIAGKVGSSDVVFVYITGLGTIRAQAGEYVSYIATLNNEYAISVDSLTTLLSSLGAAQTQVVLNPYYYDSAVSSYKPYDSTSFATSITAKVSGVVSVITNAAAGQNIILNSNGVDLFGAATSTALKYNASTGYRNADYDGDGRVSMQELYSYVYTEVSTTTSMDETPTFTCNKTVESILLKGEWKESVDYFQEKNNWWDNNGLVVSTTSDVVDSSDGYLSLREALNSGFLGMVLTQDTILYDGTTITRSDGTKEIFNFSTTTLLPGETFTIDDVEYEYTQGIRTILTDGDGILPSETSFTYKETSYIYTKENGLNVIKDLEGNTVQLFTRQNPTIDITLEDGTVVTVSQVGIKTESKVMDTIVFSDQLVGDTVLLEKELVIDNDTTANVASLTIDGSSMAGTLEINAQNKSRHFHVTNTDGKAVTLDSLILVNGQDDFGGSILNNSDNLWLVNSLLYNNTALANGSAVYNNDSSTMYIVNSTISRNNIAIETVLEDGTWILRSGATEEEKFDIASTTMVAGEIFLIDGTEYKYTEGIMVSTTQGETIMVSDTAFSYNSVTYTYRNVNGTVKFYDVASQEIDLFERVGSLEFTVRLTDGTSAVLSKTGIKSATEIILSSVFNDDQSNINVYNSIIFGNVTSDNPDDNKTVYDFYSVQQTDNVVKNSLLGDYYGIDATSFADNKNLTRNTYESKGYTITTDNTFKNFDKADFTIIDAAKVINKADTALARYWDGSQIVLDLNGASRSMYGGVDMGAYEWTSNDLNIGVNVTTTGEDDIIGNVKTSLREAVSYAGTPSLKESKLTDLEGEKFELNGSTVYAENGLFVTHNAGNYILLNGTINTLVVGDQIILDADDPDLRLVLTYSLNETTGEYFFATSTGMVVTPPDNDTSVKYIATGTTLERDAVYKNTKSVSFTDFQLLDIVTFEDNVSTGVIRYNDNGDIILNITEIIGSTITFDLNAIRDNDFGGDTTEWRNYVSNGVLTIKISEDVISIYSGVTISTANITGDDSNAFKELVITLDNTAGTVQSGLLKIDVTTGDAVTLSGTAKVGLTLTGGNNSSIGTGTGNGAALDIINGTVNVTTVDFTDNAAILNGGAISAANTSVVTITNSVFNNNNAANGGSIAAADTASITINNTSFTNSMATANGGILYLTDDSSVNILGSTSFIGNGSIDAQNGGAIYADGSAITMTGTTITGFNADKGAALYIGVGVDATLTRVSMFGNTATTAGGAIYTLGNLSATTFKTWDGTNQGIGNTVTGDSATGAGIYVGGGKATFTSSQIYYNKATGSSANGGGIYMANDDTANPARVLLLNTQVSGNSVTGNGAGIYDNTTSGTYDSLTVVDSIITGNLLTNATAGFGGGIFTNSGRVNLRSSSIVGNVGNNVGTGIYNAGSPQLNMYNTIVCGNSEKDSQAVYNVYGSYDTTNAYNLVGTNGVTSEFVVFSYNDASVTWEYWDLHSSKTASDSKIIDKGNDDFLTYTNLNNRSMTIRYDFTNRANRIINDHTDIGAYENGKQEGLISTVVNSLDDEDIDVSNPDTFRYDDKVTLREAMIYASNPSLYNVGNEITFADIDTLKANTNINGDTGTLTINVIGSLLLDNYFSIDGTIDMLDGTTKNVTVDGGSMDAKYAGASIFFVMDKEANIVMSDMTIQNGNTTSSAQEGNGGAIYMTAGYLALQQVIITGNTAAMEGGAIYQSGGSLVVTNSQIDNNVAQAYIPGSGNLGGGGIRTTGGSLTIINATITKNDAQNFGGIFVNNATFICANSNIIGNSQFVGQTVDLFTRNVNRSMMFNNIVGAMMESSNMNGINGNICGTVLNPINVNTVFTNYAGNDFTIHNSSIAVNTGNNNYAKYADGTVLLIDILGNNRFYELDGELLGTVDIGAYENNNALDEYNTVVTTLQDIIDPTDGYISLREAIRNAAKLNTTVTFNISEAELQRANGVYTIKLDGVDEFGDKYGAINLNDYKTSGALEVIYTIDASNLPNGLTIQAPTSNVSEYFNIFNLQDDTLVLKNITLTGANYDQSGAAIRMTANTTGVLGEVQLVNCLVYGNTTTSGSGAIYANGNLTLINTTIAANVSTGYAVYATNANIFNSIIAKNYSMNNTYDVTYVTGNVIASLIGAIYENIIGSATRSTNFYGDVDNPMDPQFLVNPEFNDNGELTNTPDLHLVAVSNAVNTGANYFVGQPGYLSYFPSEYTRTDRAVINTDLDSNARIFNGTVDMGCFEYSEDFEEPSVVVTTLDDIIDPTDNLISIREAITYAGTSYIGKDGLTKKVGMTITFDTSKIAGNTITLDSERGAIVINKNVTIDASNVTGGITFDAAMANRVFEIKVSGTASLISVTVKGGNAFSANGGGIYHTGGTLNIVNSLLYKNQAMMGGAIASENGTLNLTNVTITKNNVTNTYNQEVFDGTVGYGGIFSRTSMVTLKNTLVAWNTKGGDFSSPDYVFSVLHNDKTRKFAIDNYIFNNGEDYNAYYYSTFVSIIPEAEVLTGINGCMSGTPSAPLDPVFTNWDNDDFSLNKDLSLVNSPAINAGDNGLALKPNGSSLSFDLSGNARFISKIDIGAFESNLSGIEMPSTIVTTFQDIVNDSDGLISLREAINYAGNYGLSTTVTFAENVLDANKKATHTIVIDKALEIDKNVRIDGSFLGNGYTITVANGVDDRILYVKSGEVKLVGLTLTTRYTERNRNSENFTITQGGAIYLYSGNLTIMNTLIFDNKATTGAAIYVNTGEKVSLSLSNVTITDNVAKNGIIYNAGNGYMNIRNSIIAMNTASGGGNVEDVVLNYDDATKKAEKFQIFYSFVENSSDLSDHYGVSGNFTGEVGTSKDLTSEAERLFIDWDNDDFNLNNDALAVNSANNVFLENMSEKDVAGNIRVFAQLVDMGALENQFAQDNYYFNSKEEITVTTNLDVIDAEDGRVSLREAVIFAERLYDLGISKPITFSAYYLGYKPIMMLDTQSITISKPITIDASNIYSFSIDANHTNNIFRVEVTNDQKVTLKNLVLYNGSATAGGAIYHVSGQLDVLNCLIHTNKAEFSSTNPNVGESYGGAIYSNSGVLTLVNCTIANNEADYGGGLYSAVGSNVNIYNTIIAKNNGKGVEGISAGQLDGTNNSDIIVTGTSDIQYSLLGNAQALYSLNGVNGNVVGYGVDNSVDPQFVDIGNRNFHLYPDGGNNPARQSANGAYTVLYDFTIDLDGNRIGSNTTQTQARNALTYISDHSITGMTTLNTQLDESIELGSHALRVLSDLENYRTMDSLQNYYRNGLSESVTAALVLSYISLYRNATSSTNQSLQGFRDYLAQRDATGSSTDLCDTLIESENISTLSQLEVVVQNYKDDADLRWDLYFEITLYSGASNRSELIAYETTMSGEATTAQYIRNLIDANGYTTLTELTEQLTRLASPTVDMGAYQLPREAASTVVTTLDDVVDFTDGLISLREAIYYYASDNIRYVGASGPGGAYTESVGVSASYGSRSLIIDYSPITFAENLAGGTIYLTNTLEIDNGGWGNVYDTMIDASSIAHLGGITIDGSRIGGEGNIFHVNGSVDSSGNHYPGYLELHNLTLTGATGSVVYLEFPSVVELRSCLLYDNTTGITIMDNDVNYYAVANVFNTTIVNNGTGIYNRGVANIYNSIVALNGIDINTKWYGATTATTPPAYRRVNIYNSLITSINYDGWLSGRLTFVDSIYYSTPMVGHDAIFVNASENNYHLADKSLAINTGSNSYMEKNRATHADPEVDRDGNARCNTYYTTDEYGNQRVTQGIVDMGAFERNDYLDAPSTVVTTNLDVIDYTDGVISIREAIAYAEQCQYNGVSSYGQSNRFNYIVTFDETAMANATIVLDPTQGPIRLDNNIAINGGGTNVTISGGNKTGIFYIDNANGVYTPNITPSVIDVYLYNMTLTAGYAEKGGAIYINTGNVRIENVNMYGNEATFYGGAIYTAGTTNPDNMFNYELTLVDVNIGGNKAAYYGGVVSEQGPVFMVDCRIAENLATVEGANYDFYYMATINYETTAGGGQDSEHGVHNTIIGRARNLALNGHGDNNNWIAYKDEMAWDDDYGLTPDNVFNGVWADGVWTYSDGNGGLTPVWVPPTTTASELPRQRINTSLYAELASIDAEDDDLFSWLQPLE